MEKLKLLSILLLTIFFFNCEDNQNEMKNIELLNPFNNKITNLVEGKVIIENQASLSKRWEKRILKEEGKDIKLGKFEIIKADFNGNGIDDIILVATSTDNRTKTAVELIFIEGTYRMRGGSVTCTGCTSGCSPEKRGSDWSCTSCWPNTDGGCVKKETVNTYQ